MKVSTVLVLMFFTNFIFAEKYINDDLNIFSKRENYLNDFKKHFDSIQYVCIGKVIIKKQDLKYFVCLKNFKRKYHSLELDSILKMFGVISPPQPSGSFYIKPIDSSRGDKHINNELYLVFSESSRTFFINYKNSKEFIQFLGQQKIENLSPNPVHQICFKNSECTPIKKSCIEQFAINKKYLKKYTTIKEDKNVHGCATKKPEDNRIHCIDNFCTIN